MMVFTGTEGTIYSFFIKIQQIYNFYNFQFEGNTGSRLRFKNEILSSFGNSFSLAVLATNPKNEAGEERTLLFFSLHNGKATLGIHELPQNDAQRISDLIDYARSLLNDDFANYKHILDCNGDCKDCYYRDNCSYNTTPPTTTPLDI